MCTGVCVWPLICNPCFSVLSRFAVIVKAVLSGHSQNRQIIFHYRLSLNTCQKYYRMIPIGAFCNTFDIMRLPFSINTFVLTIFKRQFKTVLLYLAEEELGCWGFVCGL